MSNIGEYVNREAFKQKIELAQMSLDDESLMYDEMSRGTWNGLQDAIDILNSVESLDLTPVIHGKWINEQVVVGGFTDAWAWDCSVCGETQRAPLLKSRYCPNCGAKMD